MMIIRYCVMVALVLVFAACASQTAPTTELPPRATVALQTTQTVALQTTQVAPTLSVPTATLSQTAVLATTEVVPTAAPLLTTPANQLEWLVVPPIGASKPLPEPIQGSADIAALTPWRTVGFGTPHSFELNPSETVLAIATTAGVVYAEVPSLEVMRFDRFVGGVQAIQFDETGTMLDIASIDGDYRYSVLDGTRVGPAGEWKLRPSNDPVWIIRGPQQIFEAEFQVPDAVPPPGVVIRRIEDQTVVYEDAVSFSATFSPNEHYVVLRGNDEIVRLVDFATMNVTEILLPTVAGATFSPDGQTLLTSGTSLQVWDVVSGRLLQSKPLSVQQERPLIAMEFVHQEIAFDLGVGLVTVFGNYYEFETGSPQRTTWSMQGTTVGEPIWNHWLPSIGMVNFSTYKFAVNPAAQFVAVTNDGFELEWRAADQTIFVQPLPVQITALEFNPEGTLLAVGLADGRVLLTQLIDYSVIQEIQTSGQPHAFGFSRDGTLLAGLATDGTLTVWDVVNGSQINQFADIPNDQNVAYPLNKPTFTADNLWVLMPNIDGVNMYAVNGLLVGSLDAPASTVALGPHRRLLLTVADGIVTLWGRE